MNTSTTLQAVRAIMALQVKKLLRPVGIIVGVVLGLTWILSLYLITSISSWWALTLIVIVPVTLVVVGVIVLALQIVNRLTPRKFSRKEAHTLNRFSGVVTTRLLALRTPAPLLLGSLLFDLVRKRQNSQVMSVINDSRQLRDDFTNIQTMFK